MNSVHTSKSIPRQYQAMAPRHIASLMRLYRVTIADLADRMNITKKRVREVLQKGVTGKCMCLDWYEGIAASGIFARTRSTPKGATAGMTVYSGYVTIEGVRVQVDFEAPTSANTDQTNTAFLAALAAKVDFDYLEIGQR